MDTKLQRLADARQAYESFDQLFREAFIAQKRKGSFENFDLDHWLAERAKYWSELNAAMTDLLGITNARS